MMNIKNRWDIFFVNIQQDLKCFLYIWIVLNIFRLIFIITMKEYWLTDTNFEEILTAIYYGARISLKTAAALWAGTFLFVTLPQTIFHTEKLNFMRIWISSLYTVVLSLIFMAQFPYYKEFHVGFNQMIFNTFQDDESALFYTLIDQYQLFQRVIVVLIMAVLFTYVVKRILKTKTLSFYAFSNRIVLALTRSGVVIFLILLAIFVRFGGSLAYAGSIHWENGSKCKDPFLNEAILDQGQSMYRAYSIKKRIEEGTASGVEQANLKNDLLEIAQKKHIQIPAEIHSIDDYLVHQASGPKIEKPKHVFIIIGESYAAWPTLDKYADLHIADGLRSIEKEPDAVFVSRFMPNGAFTPMAVNAVISGLNDVNIYPNHQPESYRQVYKTALAPQLKKLGYKTVFWYAGFSGWERIQDFALAQGFDEFHSASDIPYGSGNVWGCDDEYLFNAIQSYAEQETEPTVHVILSVSNHAPYSVDLTKAGFDADTTIENLPDNVRNNADLINRLGHYWYTDKIISEFTKKIKKAYPNDSLFMITGDHADRTNIDAQPTIYERYTIPFVLYGHGVDKNIFPPDIAGGHVNINATLLELIAPKGFVYYSLGESLTEAPQVGFNHNMWETDAAAGEIDGENAEVLPDVDRENVSLADEKEKAMETIRRMRTISWWRTMKGNEF